MDGYSRLRLAQQPQIRAFHGYVCIHARLFVECAHIYIYNIGWGLGMSKELVVMQRPGWPHCDLWQDSAERR